MESLKILISGYKKSSSVIRNQIYSSGNQSAQSKKIAQSLDHLKIGPILVWTLIEHSPAATSQTLGSAWIFAKFPKFSCVRKKKNIVFLDRIFKNLKTDFQVI